LIRNQNPATDQAITGRIRPLYVNEIISFLFITYNRSDLLTRAFTTLREAVLKAGLPAEFVVSDDASSPEHQEVINRLGFDTRAMATVNVGLGANQNKGLACCKGELIFQIQDDLIFVGQPSDLTDAIRVLQSDPEVGIVQLTEVWSDMLSERRLTQGGVEYDVFRNDRLPWNRDCGLRPYSDLPHLKSVHFVEEIGPYLEGVAMALTEQDFKRRVASQGRWRVAQMSSRKLFIHVGTEHSLNPRDKRNKLVALLHKIPYAGKWIEPALRKTWRKADHLAAMLASRLLS
jgi:GT2 family glycosyltransferase